MVALDGLHGRNAAQLGERLGGVDVAGVEDQVDAVQQLLDPGRQPVEELGAVGVGDDADANRAGWHPTILNADGQRSIW